MAMKWMAMASLALLIAMAAPVLSAGRRDPVGSRASKRTLLQNWIRADPPPSGDPPPVDEGRPPYVDPSPPPQPPSPRQPDPQPQPHPQPEPYGNPWFRCFPGDATVLLPDGSTKPMTELKVGDSVATTNSFGSIVFEPVYFFGHRLHHDISPYVRVTVRDLASNSTSRTLELSAEHFVHNTAPGTPAKWSLRKTTRASLLSPGSTLWIARSTEMEPATVTSVERVFNRGMFNPYTMGGDIVVNGVLASSHSDWELDSLVPAKWDHHLPFIYQKLFAPIRGLYHLLGPAAMEAVHEKAAVAKKGTAAYFLREMVAWPLEKRVEL